MELNLEGLLNSAPHPAPPVVVVALGADSGFETLPLAGWAVFVSLGKGLGARVSGQQSSLAPCSGL